MPEAKKPRYDDQCPSSEEHFRTVLAKFTDVQEKLRQLAMEMSDEGLTLLHQLSQQYSSLKAPHYSARAELLQTLPNFWSQVFLNHPLLSQLFTVDDSEILSYLSNVAVHEYADIQCGFRIEFAFNENPFFVERCLVKTITYSQDGNMVVEGTSPTWKADMDPSESIEPKARHKRKSQKSYSFFLWFGETGKMELGAQDNMALLVRNDIWSNPMQYYKRPTSSSLPDDLHQTDTMVQETESQAEHFPTKIDDSEHDMLSEFCELPMPLEGEAILVDEPMKEKSARSTTPSEPTDCDN